MGVSVIKYISVKEAAEKWNISISRVHQYIKRGRIEGAYKRGNAWAIPDDIKKPDGLLKAVTIDIKK
jgi:predicted site-specific integrase-resolvase